VVKKCDTSAEALVRWVHPKEGMISPARFIPLFERNGFIVRLDHYVWEEVCRLLAEERDKLGRVVPVSVNVSRLDFYDENLLEFFMGLMKKYDLEPWMIKLEVTESAYTDNPQQIMTMMRRFQDAGFKFLMDDFGSGYSSLSMLRNLPVDILKIDMKFVQEIVTSFRAAKIMEHMVQLAHDIHMEVVIEGVETKEQVEFLQEIGCDEIQGYYFSKPMSKDEYIERLAESPVVGEGLEKAED
jgi:EAL domain-containing protein (putative c-di-GMP-specific phosphodiesterase class I)